MMSMDSDTTTLVRVTDADFEWMLGGVRPEGRHYNLAPGGVDDDAVLEIVRGMTRALHRAACYGSWLIVAGDEVVGLCSYKRPPSGGEIEIGYGIAKSRRGLGHASRAVAAMLTECANDDAVQVVVAKTSVTNVASQRVLEKNAFQKTGERADPEDGDLFTWSRVLTRT